MLTPTTSMARVWNAIPFVTLALALSACGGGSGGGDGGITAQGRTLSGTISITDGALADSDTNDPLSSNNDNTASAQQIENPALIGGFVAAAQTNQTHANSPLPADRFASSTDVSDFYVASLDHSQSVRLTNMTPGSSALTLVVDDGNTPAQDTTTASEASVSVSPASSGQVTIEVRADSGFTPYQLAISSPGYTCSTGATAEFAPGEILVRLREAGTASAGNGVTAEQLGMKNARAVSARTQLWDMGNAEQALARLHQLGLTTGLSRLHEGHAKRTAREATLAAVEALEGHPAIESAMPNYVYRSFATPGDDEYAEQWSLPRINLPAAWDTSKGVDGTDPVVVAVLDTGIFATHEDLQPKLTGDGYDFVGADSDPSDGGNGTFFHGSHVAGIAAAATTDQGGTGPGIAGVGWDAVITPVKVLGANGGTLTDVIQGARYAAGLSNSSGALPARPAQIINMSLGGKGGCLGDAASEAFDTIRRGPDGDLGTPDDVILIAAAGNAGDDAPQFPASYSSVISVSATDRNDELAWYSSFGPFVDVAAPGGDTSSAATDGILSTVAADSGGSLMSEYAYFQGTSMAAPHVAGVAALMEAAHPALNADLFETALRQQRLTTDISASTAERTDEFGYGLIDAEAAVTWASGGASLGPMVTAQPEVISYETESGTQAVTRTITVRESSGDALDTLTNLTVTADGESPADWLAVSATTTAGEYEATIDPTVVSDGTYSASVTIATDNGGSTEIPVLLRKGVDDVTEDASRHYILLINADTGKTVQLVEREATGGSYQFEFSGVANGNYYIGASSDIDNNSNLCEPWEACGVYPATITVSVGDVDRINFETGFGSVTAGEVRSAMKAATRPDR